MHAKFLILLFTFSFASCKSKENDAETVAEEKFDKTKWLCKKDAAYPYRNSMLKDMMASKRWHGVKKDSLLNQFGAPDRADTNYLFYRISQERLGYFPIHTKTLVIKFTKDTTVEWLKIHE